MISRQPLEPVAGTGRRIGRETARFLFSVGGHREHKGLPYARLVKYSETGSEEETCKALILLDLLVDDLELLPII